jgi:hypothetical protein
MDFNLLLEIVGHEPLFETGADPGTLTRESVMRRPR